MLTDLPVSTVLGYMPDNKYLDLAPVSKLFSAKYAPRLTQISEDTSINNMVEYFRNGMPTTEHITFKASEMGRIDLFQIAIEHGCVVSHKAMEVAARLGHLQILQYTGFRFRFVCHQCVCTGASKGGRLDVLRWMFPERNWRPEQLVLSRLLTRNAVVGGFISVVAWAHDKGQDLDSALLSTAATHGHFELVKYIHHNQVQPEGASLGEYPISPILHAALRGDLRTVTWLRDKGYPWSDGVCMLLARRGHLKALKYARDNGCPWGMLRIGSVGPVIDQDMRDYLVDSACPVW